LELVGRICAITLTSVITSFAVFVFVESPAAKIIEQCWTLVKGRNIHQATFHRPVQEGDKHLRETHIGDNPGEQEAPASMCVAQDSTPPEGGSITLDISRDSTGSSGFKYNAETLVITEVEEGRPELSSMRVGSLIKAINGTKVTTRSDYLREAVGVQNFKLTLQSEAPVSSKPCAPVQAKQAKRAQEISCWSMLGARQRKR
jgi:hypothetical protein